MFGLGVLVGLFLFPVIETVLDKFLPDPFRHVPKPGSDVGGRPRRKAG